MKKKPKVARARMSSTLRARTRDEFDRLLPPITSNELRFAMSLASAAAEQHLAPTRTPLAYRFDLRERGGKVQEVRFSDTPHNRAMFAIKEHFKNDTEPNKFLSVFCRLHRLGEAANHPAFARWCKPLREDVTSFHPALLDEIATEPLEFDVAAFEPDQELADRVSARAARGGYDEE